MKRIADAFYVSYPGVKQFQETIVRRAAEEATVTSNICAISGQPRTQFLFKCPITSRRYKFMSYPGFVWNKGRKTNGQKMSPTELKNYTVQGFSTADFVPFAVKHCVAYLAERYTYGIQFKFVNTIHDSIQFQCKPEIVEEFSNCLKYAMTQSWKAFLESCKVPKTGEFGFLHSLPMMGEIESGDSWGAME